MTKPISNCCKVPWKAPGGDTRKTAVSLAAANEVRFSCSIKRRKKKELHWRVSHLTTCFTPVWFGQNSVKRWLAMGLWHAAPRKQRKPQALASWLNSKKPGWSTWMWQTEALSLQVLPAPLQTLSIQCARVRNCTEKIRMCAAENWTFVHVYRIFSSKIWRVFVLQTERYWGARDMVSWWSMVPTFAGDV